MGDTSSDTTDALFLEAEKAERAKEYPAAKALYVQALAENHPRWIAITFRLGQLSEKEKNYPEAIQYYQQLIQKKNAKSAWCFRLGECHRHLKKWRQAESFFRKAAVLDPGNSLIYLRLSQCAMALRDFQQADIDIEAALHLSRDPKLQAQKGLVLMKLGELDAAIVVYKQAISESGESVESTWLFRLAECYQKSHQLDEAISFFKQATELNATKAAWHARLAGAYLQLGDCNSAISCFRQATKLDDSKPEWFAELGRLLADTDKQAAIAAYSRAVELGRKALSYEIAVLSCDGQSLQYVEPEVLFTAKRFDLCLKLLYARSLLGLTGSNSAINPTELYLRHVHLRTKGKEPDNLTKTSLADYQQSFLQLLESMQQHGFDESHAIPLAQDGGLLNGAHRAAAATALRLAQVPVVFMDRPQGISWDFDWFMQRGFNLDELNELLLCWLENTPERGHIIILWPAVAEHWDTITADIANELELVTQRDINLTAVGFSELIKDIYSTDKVAEFMPNILAKVDKLAAYSPQLRVLVVYGDSRRVNAIKARVRQQYDAIVPEQSFCTLHASADHAEALHMGHILFHQPTLALLQNRTRPLSEHLCAWIAEAKQALVSRAASVQDGCVVGGAVLDAYEVRQADDLDMTVSSAVRQAHFTDKACPLTDTIDIVNKDYARSVSGVIRDDDLLTDRALHLYVRGFKFASLDVVRQRKSYSQREKDLVDLAKITRYVWQVKRDFY